MAVIPDINTWDHNFYLDMLDKLHIQVCRTVGVPLKPWLIFKIWPNSVFPVSITFADVHLN